ncbi:UNVERIFIED_CONTAM: Disease resistance protein RPP13 [Sesamum calycinum]|uniref:Disease resistance protein RPP13 n=1 Tax=Sesamum calycinum TaxID=2727403 RepID=A0AAW2Q584_9LAMI
MAEFAIPAALGSAEIVISLLVNFNLRPDVQREIQDLQSWLRSMKAFLEDNDGREGSRTLQDHMEKVRDIAYDIEDVLDEFVLHSPPYTFHNHRITRMVHNFAHNVHHRFPLRGISDKIANINRSIKNIQSQRVAFPDNYCSSTPLSNSRTGIEQQVSPPLLDDEMAGYEEPKRTFIRHLVDGEKGLVTLAVVGPGGSGKRLFVKNVLWKRGIQGKFDCHACVHVYQHFNVGELFINMLKQLCYSRKEPIVVTTTCSTVASVCASSSDHVCRLNGFEWSEGWKLLRRKAFPDSSGECPSELKDSSDKIDKKCEIRRGSELSVIGNPLLPGYMVLSSNLKCCFLYFSIFPEDYSVNCGRLIRLWVAERFATATAEKTEEEVAEDYLNALIHRDLVHVSNRDFDGRPRSCRVLNLAFKFIIQKCKDENFASIFRRANTSQSQKIRRLSIHNDCTHLPKKNDLKRVRSMFLLGLLEISLPDFEGILRKSKLQRVLDLQGSSLTEISEDITNLTLLRYLSLRDTKITKVPSSIKKLSYLETLDLRQTDITELPKEISYLHNLRHLFAYKKNVSNYVVFDSVRGVKIPGGIRHLTNLQDLSLVMVDAKGRILKHLKELSQLRKLGLTGLLSEHGEALSASIEQMENLITLDLCSASEAEYLEVTKMTNPPHTLQHLYLKGLLRELPQWISSLDNLLRIGLKWSKTEKSPLPALASLPNLVELQLVDCYIGEELIFEAYSFKKLKNLVIEEFSQLRTIVIQDGAMPELKEMSLGKCPELMFPGGIHNLAKVEKLSVYDMGKEFVDRIRRNGEDQVMVGRIPVVHFQ